MLINLTANIEALVTAKVVTPVPGFRRDRVTGVQVFCKSINKLDSGFAGMTEKGLLGLLTKPSISKVF
jgi:hypothetical protein